MRSVVGALGSVLALLSVGVATACSSSAEPAAQVIATADAGPIDDATADASGPVACDPYVARSPVPEVQIGPTGFEAALLAEIGAAKKSLDMMAFDVGRKAVLTALVDAKKRGVAVRVVADKGRAKTLRGALGAEAVHDSSFPAAHSKLLIVDGARAQIGSGDLTDVALEKHRTAAVVLSDAASLGELKALFEADWAGAPSAPTSCSLVVTPGDAAARIAHHIASAETALDVEVFTATEPTVIAAIKERAGAGVRVRVLLAGPELAKPNEATGAELVAAGCEVRFYRDFEVHAGLVVTDKGAIGGSDELAVEAFTANRHFSAVVTDDGPVKALRAQFDADWPKGALR